MDLRNGGLHQTIEDVRKQIVKLDVEKLDSVCNIYIMGLAVQNFCLEHIKPMFDKETKMRINNALKVNKMLLSSIERDFKVHQSEEAEDNYYAMQGFLYNEFKELITKLQSETNNQKL